MVNLFLRKGSFVIANLDLSSAQPAFPNRMIVFISEFRLM